MRNILEKRIKTGRLDLSVGDFCLLLFFMTVIFSGLLAWEYQKFLKSDAYAIGQGLIQSDPIIKEKIGDVKERKLSILNLKQRSTSQESFVEFHINLQGSKSDGIIYFEMKNLGSGWLVESTKFQSTDGNIIDIGLERNH